MTREERVDRRDDLCRGAILQERSRLEQRERLGLDTHATVWDIRHPTTMVTKIAEHFILLSTGTALSMWTSKGHVVLAASSWLAL